MVIIVHCTKLSSLAQIYKQIHESKFILWELHDNFFVPGSVQKRKLHEHWQTAVSCLAKFCVSYTGKLLLVLMIFH